MCNASCLGRTCLVDVSPTTTVRWEEGRLMKQNGIAYLMMGCAGFIGSHLTERLLDAGCAVIGVDNFATGPPRNMAVFLNHPVFAFSERDVREPGFVAMGRTVRPGLFRLFHLAAVVSVPFSVEHPRETIGLNLDASLSLHESARNAGLAGEAKRPLAGVYNLGTGRATSILALAKRVWRLPGDARGPEFLPPRQGDIRHSVADGSKITAAGFLPRLSLEAGLTGLID